jgi:hypothetical protein
MHSVVWLWAYISVGIPGGERPGTDRVLDEADRAVANGEVGPAGIIFIPVELLPLAILTR